MQITTTVHFRISKKSADDERYVEGVVYAPNDIDTHRELMLKEDIKLMCERYMKNVAISKSIDTRHDQLTNGSYPTQCYLAKANDPDGYPEGAWILGVKIEDDNIWEQVKAGVISGFSWQALITPVPVTVTIEYFPNVVGVTEEHDGHKHFFSIDLDEFGKVVKGMTDTVNGHSHLIVAGTATEETDGHAHRYFIK